MKISFNIGESYIHGIYDAESDELGIIDLYVKGEYRNKGIGTKLIKKIILYTYTKYKVKIVKLDDMSDKYRKKNNIYLKLGFHYDEIWGPEMTVLTTTFLRKNKL